MKMHKKTHDFHIVLLELIHGLAQSLAAEQAKFP